MSELPAQWAQSSIGDVAESMKNGVYKPADAYSEDGIACLRMYNVEGGKIVWKDIKRMRLSKDDFEMYRLLPGDLLVNRVNSRELVGKAAMIPEGLEPCVFESKNIRLRLLTELVEPKFVALKLLLDGSRHFANNAQQVVGMASISQPQLAAFPIPLPPLAEQKRIVAKIEELFSELEAGEESLRVARRQLGVYRQSLLKQAFEGKLTAKWRTQNPANLESPAQLLARIQSTRQSPPEGTVSRGGKRAVQFSLETSLVESLPNLPDSWKWTALGNLSHLVTKGSSPKWQGFDYISDPTGVLFVTSENVRTGFLDLSRPKYLGLGFNEIQPASVLRDGDVLLNIVGASIGRAATFRGHTLANINQAVSLIRPTEFLDHAFLTYHLNSTKTYQLITSKAVDVARANFSLADVNEVPVPLCSLPEQQEIVRLLDEQFEVIERNEREIDAALKRSEALRQAILQKAFTGRLVPQDPADEPAATLLARLRAERTASPASKRKPALQS